ncbi:hypothetical protein B0H34DRAFT_728653 [Crassisporium funariophilum]|nr:hypothetical protein B0H34DRAFT_728653 [Crassisporium funariophilum]
MNMNVNMDMPLPGSAPQPLSGASSSSAGGLGFGSFRSFGVAHPISSAQAQAQADTPLVVEPDDGGFMFPTTHAALIHLSSSPSSSSNEDNNTPRLEHTRLSRSSTSTSVGTSHSVDMDASFVSSQSHASSFLDDIPSSASSASGSEGSASRGNESVTAPPLADAGGGTQAGVGENKHSPTQKPSGLSLLRPAGEGSREASPNSRGRRAPRRPGRIVGCVGRLRLSPTAKQQVASPFAPSPANVANNSNSNNVTTDTTPTATPMGTPRPSLPAHLPLPSPLPLLSPLLSPLVSRSERVVFACASAYVFGAAGFASYAVFAHSSCGVKFSSASDADRCADRHAAYRPRLCDRALTQPDVDRASFSA